jgi:DNA-binding response OmpR family regulator
MSSPEDAGPSPPIPTLPCPTILLAEDDVELRRLIAGQLGSAGFDVCEAKNGGELIDFLARIPCPDLLITDVRMPGISGLQVVQGLRRARRRIPVIVITAFGSEETHSLARALGAAEVFDKPLDIDELVECAARLISPAQSRPRGVNE